MSWTFSLTLMAILAAFHMSLPTVSQGTSEQFYPSLSASVSAVVEIWDVWALSDKQDQAVADITISISPYILLV